MVLLAAVAVLALDAAPDWRTSALGSAPFHPCADYDASQVNQPLIAPLLRKRFAAFGGR